MSNLQAFPVSVHGISPQFFAIVGGFPVSLVSSTSSALGGVEYIMAGFVQSVSVQGSFSHDTFIIGDLPSDTHSLVESIEAKISYIDGEYLAEFPEAEIVTSGETAEEAIQWLKETIVSLYKFYDNNRETLGPLPGRQLSILEAYIAEKQAREA